MAKILVTGGAGYIGSHFCKMAARQGHDLAVIDNLSTGNKWALRWGRFYEGDLRNPSDIDRALEQFRPDAVVHFAGSALVGESVLHPEKYAENNTAATRNLINAMRDNGVKNIVFSSTCAVYGQPESFPITEQTPPNPINPYGLSKLEAEKAIKQASSEWGLNYTILRYFNVAGSDPELEIGENHDPETHIVPNTLTAIFKRKALQVYGDDYGTPDGTCIRDYVHVMDLANAHILALHRHANAGFQSEVINLGSGNPCSVKSIIENAEKVTGQEALIEYMPRRPGDPPTLYADNSRAKAVLGWNPERSRIDVVINDAWQWERIKERKISAYKNDLS